MTHFFNIRGDKQGGSKQTSCPGNDIQVAMPTRNTDFPDGWPPMQGHDIRSNPLMSFYNYNALPCFICQQPEAELILNELTN